MDGEVISQATGATPVRSLLAWAGAGRAPRARTRWMLSASSLIAALAILAMAATLITAVIGYALAQHSDERIWAEQREALRNAVGEFRQLFTDPGAIDPRFVRMIEQSARLQGLKFETDPPLNTREMQPVVDAQGRIAGFFTWDKTYPMTVAMHRLMPLLAASPLRSWPLPASRVRQLKRARRDMAASEELARRAADEDKLTGLPNHAKTLELLDLALAERADDEVVSFALIELDGMADVNAQLGVLGADEFIIAVGKRLGEALPAGAIVRPRRRRRVRGDAHRRRRNRCRSRHS